MVDFAKRRTHCSRRSHRIGCFVTTDRNLKYQQNLALQRRRWASRMTGLTFIPTGVHHEHSSIRRLSLRVRALPGAWGTASHVCVPLQGLPTHDGHDQLCRVYVPDGCGVALWQRPVHVRTSVGEQCQNRLRPLLPQVWIDGIAHIRAVAAVQSYLSWCLR